MTVNVENGQNIIDILSDGFVTCLKVQKPIAIDWYDCAGSLGKYFAFTTDYEPLAKQYSELLVKGDDAEISIAITDFLNLFSSGQYSFFFNRNDQTEYRLHFEYENIDNSNNYLYNYYNPSDNNIMFTQPKNKINTERVKYYENLILDGVRPKSILFQSFLNDSGTNEDGSTWVSSFDSPIFILDGHHKLMAYKNLKITPEFVIIFKERIGREELLKSKENLYFEYDYFLTEESKHHIISHSPKLLTENNTRTENYNFHFDNYLTNSDRMETAILELFKSASVSEDKNKISWLLNKLEILKVRNFEEKTMWLHYKEFTDKYPLGIWNMMEVKSNLDFRKWLGRMFDKNIDGLINNIT